MGSQAVRSWDSISFHLFLFLTYTLTIFTLSQFLLKVLLTPSVHPNSGLLLDVFKSAIALITDFVKISLIRPFCIIELPLSALIDTTWHPCLLNRSQTNYFIFNLLSQICYTQLTYFISNIFTPVSVILIYQCLDLYFTMKTIIFSYSSIFIFISIP